MSTELSKTPAQNFKDLLVKYRSELKGLMPANLSDARLLQICLSEVKNEPRLLACQPKSLIDCVIEAFRLGFDPGGALGYCYFVPYRDHAQFQLGYPGIAELIYRSGKTGAITTGVVYKGDEFFFEKGKNQDLKHIPCGNIKEEDITHFYSYTTVNGLFSFEVMTNEDVQKTKKQATARKKRQDGPWFEHYAPMGRKTVLIRHAHSLPKSIEAARLIKEDQIKEFGAPDVPDIDVGDKEPDWQDVKATVVEQTEME